MWRTRSASEASAAGSRAVTRPARSTVTVWATARTRGSLCVTSNTVTPCSATRPRTARRSASTSGGVRAEVGSSRMRTRAPAYRAFRISTHCFSPSDSCQTRASRSTRTPYRSQRAATSRRAAPKSITPRAARGCPSRTFSSTVCAATSLRVWWTMPIPRAKASWGDRNWTRSPRTYTSPSSGCTRPNRTFMRVVLPAPFWPRTAWTSPSRTSKSTPASAITPGNRLVMPRAASTTARSGGRPCVRVSEPFPSAMRRGLGPARPRGPQGDA
ncbi:hypothetical protein HRbin32_00049 [bacterium HR32]|nr:hypothetical protein HRbin32_00049 [bacterium HR32]